MSADELNDDLGHAKPPYRVVACLAVHGRLPLLEHTIRRLYVKNGCYKVICSGDGLKEKELCESMGAVWAPHNNKPLGAKWNASFYKAREYNPDAVVFVGSSDWLCNDWFSIMKPHVEKHGFAGVPGCSLADVAENIRVCHWSGYAGYRSDRASESIGIGRMLSRRLLDAIDWLPFDPKLDNSLDWSMKEKAAKVGFTDVMIRDERLKALSLSTPLWMNKHHFGMHWSGQIPSEKELNPEEWVRYNFPEVLELHKTLYDRAEELLRHLSRQQRAV